MYIVMRVDYLDAVQTSNVILDHQVSVLDVVAILDVKLARDVQCAIQNTCNSTNNTKDWSVDDYYLMCEYRVCELYSTHPAIRRNR